MSWQVTAAGAQGVNKGSTAQVTPGSLAQVDRQAAGTSAAEPGVDPVLAPDVGYTCMENPRDVGTGPEALSSGQGGRGQQVVLCSGEINVIALEEQANPS